MTSNKDLKRQIIERILDSLASLPSLGFSKPTVKQNGWSTSIDFKLTNIALEIEVDWRELDIFVLIVRLENGDLPKGYYISEGRPCRYHLQKVIGDRRWSVDQEALSEISHNGKGKQQSNLQPEDMMFERFLSYKKVLDSCVDRLIEEERIIFS